MNIEVDLTRLKKLDKIELCQTAEFGVAPIVLVSKLNGTIQICGDLKFIVNRFFDIKRYLLPNLEELLAALTGGLIF